MSGQHEQNVNNIERVSSGGYCGLDCMNDYCEVALKRERLRIIEDTDVNGKFTFVIRKYC